jgi:hypothetical protein
LEEQGWYQGATSVVPIGPEKIVGLSPSVKPAPCAREILETPKGNELCRPSLLRTDTFLKKKP